jgi:hypothetical protein
VTTFALCEGLLRLESRAAGAVIFSLVRFFASKQTPPVFFRLVLFFPVHLRFFILGVALEHGSRHAVSPCFLRRQYLSRFSLSIFRRCRVLLVMVSVRIDYSGSHSIS